MGVGCQRPEALIPDAALFAEPPNAHIVAALVVEAVLCLGVEKK